MTHSRKSFRLPRSFSLRTLLIAVTALAVWLGYYMNWVHQRHAFLAKQFELLVAAVPASIEKDRREWVKMWLRRSGEYGMNLPAPWSLRLFGETGIGGLLVIVPESDINMRTWGYDEAGLPVEWPEISATQPDYRRAKRLFPEAEIQPVRSGIWSIKYHGGERSDWLKPLVIGEQARETRVRLECDKSVIEGALVRGRIEIAPTSGGIVIIEYRTCDGSATSLQQNFTESSDKRVFQHRTTALSSTSSIRVETGRLTEEQRAAGGATFKIKLGTVIGAVPEETEKTITILPRQDLKTAQATAPEE